MASSPAAASGADQSASRASAKPGSFWPNGAGLAISNSLMFEGGGQPISGAGGAVPEPVKPGYPDQVTNAFFDYGVNEGIPRALDLFDKHGIKVTSFMIGEAIKKHPELAREIVRRGHEPAAHGTTWTTSYDLPREQEKAFIKDSADMALSSASARSWRRASCRPSGAQAQSPRCSWG